MLNISVNIYYISSRNTNTHIAKNTRKKGFPGGTCGKEPTCQSRRHKRCGIDPWVRKIPGGRHCDPLQYSCLENPMDREAWKDTVHVVPKSQAR